MELDQQQEILLLIQSVEFAIPALLYLICNKARK